MHIFSGSKMAAQNTVSVIVPSRSEPQQLQEADFPFIINNSTSGIIKTRTTMTQVVFIHSLDQHLLSLP